MLLQSQGTDLQTLTAIMIVTANLAFQLRVQPYLTPTLNNAESAALTVQFCTLMLGLYLYSDNIGYKFRVFLTTLVFVVNFLFVWFMGHCFYTDAAMRATVRKAHKSLAGVRRGPGSGGKGSTVHNLRQAMATFMSADPADQAVETAGDDLGVSTTMPVSSLNSGGAPPLIEAAQISAASASTDRTTLSPTLPSSLLPQRSPLCDDSPTTKFTDGPTALNDDAVDTTTTNSSNVQIEMVDASDDAADEDAAGDGDTFSLAMC